MQMDGFLTLKGGNVELVGAPETIFVLPIGHVVSSKGEFDVDDESYKAMKAQIAKRGVDLVVDYEHQTLKGCEAPAASSSGRPEGRGTLRTRSTATSPRS